MEDDYIPGVWDYVTTRFFGWEPKRSLSFEQRVELWQKQVNGGMLETNHCSVIVNLF
jgi:hypothetical protein